MKRFACITVAITAMALAADAMTSQAPAPKPPNGVAGPEPRDLTLMRPALRIEGVGKIVRVHGVWRVFRPSGLGVNHDVAVRLIVSKPGGDDAIPPKELTRIDYRRDHGEAAYKIDKDVDIGIDTTGMDLSVAAVDRQSGRVFASFTVHARK
jgi:hypothetical protein